MTTDLTDNTDMIVYKEEISVQSDQSVFKFTTTDLTDISDNNVF